MKWKTQASKKNATFPMSKTNNTSKKHNNNKNESRTSVFGKMLFFLDMFFFFIHLSPGIFEGSFFHLLNFCCSLLVASGQIFTFYRKQSLVFCLNVLFFASPTKILWKNTRESVSLRLKIHLDLCF